MDDYTYYSRDEYHWRLQFNLTWSLFSLKKTVGHIKVLYISDGFSTKLTFNTSYYICSWLLIILFSNEWCLLKVAFFWKTMLVVSYAKILHHIFIAINGNFETIIPVWFEQLKELKQPYSVLVQAQFATSKTKLDI